MNRTRGFTLLELLVAVAVFGIVSVIAYGGLEAVLASRNRVSTEAERLGALQTAFTILARDFRHAADRPYRDQLGDRQPPMHRDGQRLMLVRGGRANPLNLHRSAYQRIAYGLDEGELVRYSWRAVDSPFEPDVSENALLDGVEDLSFRFLSEDWQDQWPPPRTDTDAPALPQAVAIRITHEDYGEIQRVFLLP